jgi:hypothetical protein
MEGVPPGFVYPYLPYPNAEYFNLDIYASD